MTRLAFAFGAGLLSTVSPCGFAMLPAFLGFYAGGGESGARSTAARIGQGLAVGGSISAGFAATFVAVSLLLSAGLRPVLRVVPWVAVVVGAGLLGLGVAMAVGRRIPLPLPGQLRPGTGRSRRQMVVFGAAYATASLSCTLGVLLAVVAQAVATADLFEMLLVFVGYSAGAATVLTALAVSVALASDAVGRAVRRVLPWTTRLGGALLAVSGAYLLAYWLPQLRGSRPAPGVALVADRLAAPVASLLDANRDLFAGVGAVLAVAAAVVVVRTRSRRSAVPAAPRRTD